MGTNYTIQNATIHYYPTNILTLPTSLTTIETEAFINLPNIDAIRLPANITTIASDAFDPGMILLVPEGSPWIQWADEHGYQPIVEDTISGFGDGGDI